ncbi:MAG: hypothetical protein RIC14_04700 [Filomicrobium sp.]
MVQRFTRPDLRNKDVMRFASACFIAGLLLASVPFAKAQTPNGTPDPQGWAPGVTVSPSDGWATQSRPADEPAAPTDDAQPSEAAKEARKALRSTLSGPGLQVTAKLTDDARNITSDLIWRIYSNPQDRDTPPELLSRHTDNVLRAALEPGLYIVNVSLGQAHLTRRLEVKPGRVTRDVFVLNAGGLRLTAYAGEKRVPNKSVLFDVYEAERDQSGQRQLVVGKLRPGVVVRLNAGIYYLKSVYGGANAGVESEVSVEAGKLTEIAMAHAAARVTLGLVNRPGGEALPATRWTIATPEGDVVSRSVGAVPSHILAPGTYKVTAQNGGREFVREFSIEDSQQTKIEVVVQ